MNSDIFLTSTEAHEEHFSSPGPKASGELIGCTQAGVHPCIHPHFQT